MVESSLFFHDKPARPVAPALEAGRRATKKVGADGTVAGAYFFFGAGIS
jgi:hypothetical protein